MNRRSFLAAASASALTAQVSGNARVSGAGGFSRTSEAASAQDAVLVIGQSLAAGGNAEPPISTTQPYTNIMFAGGLKHPSDLSGYVPLTEDLVNESPSSGFANQVAAYQRAAVPGSAARDLLVSNWATGAQAYAVLKKGGSGVQYANSMASVVAAVASPPPGKSSIKVRALVNVHGEADSGSGAYAGHLAEWQSDYESDIQAATGQTDAVPMLISDFNHYGYAGAMYEAYAANPSKIVLVCPKYFLEHSDGVHLTNATSRVLGEYYAKAYWQHVILGTQWHPLRPSTVSRSGSVITLVYNHGRVGNLVFDTTSVANWPDGNYGFTYTDSAATIQSVAITDAANGVVQVTLTGTPAVPGRLYYAPEGPSGYGPTTGPRGNLRDSDTAVGLSGTTLYNWATNWRQLSV